MNIRNTIVKHYKKFFDLHAKGISLTEDDHLDIDWAESLVKDCFIADVSQRSELFFKFIDKHYSHSSENYRQELKDSFAEYLKNCG